MMDGSEPSSCTVLQPVAASIGVLKLPGGELQPSSDLCELMTASPFLPPSVLEEPPHPPAAAVEVDETAREVSKRTETLLCRDMRDGVLGSLADRCAVCGTVQQPGFQQPMWQRLSHQDSVLPSGATYVQLLCALLDVQLETGRLAELQLVCGVCVELLVAIDDMERRVANMREHVRDRFSAWWPSDRTSPPQQHAHATKRRRRHLQQCVPLNEETEDDPDEDSKNQLDEEYVPQLHRKKAGSVRGRPRRAGVSDAANRRLSQIELARNLVCSSCPFFTFDSAALRAHIRQVHGSFFTCPVCQLKFSYRDSLLRHVGKHKPLMESTQSMPVRDWTQLQCSSDGSITLSCPDCRLALSVSTDERRQLLVCGAGSASCAGSVGCRRVLSMSEVAACFGDGKYALTCLACGLQFQDHAHMDRHLTQEHAAGGLVCLLCGCYVAHVDGFRLHATFHAALQESTCRLCPFRTYSATHVYSHVLQHYTPRGQQDSATLTVSAQPAVSDVAPAVHLPVSDGAPTIHLPVSGGAPAVHPSVSYGAPTIHLPVSYGAPAVHPSVSDGAPTIHLPVSDGAPTIHPAVSDGAPAIHPSVSDGAPAIHLPVSDGTPAVHLPVSDGAPAVHPSVSDGAPAVHPSVSDGAPTIHLPVSDGAPTIHLPVSDGVPAVHLPVSDGAPAIHLPVSDGAPAIHIPVSDGAPAVHPSVSDATPSTHSSVSDATPAVHPSVSDATPSTHPSVSDATPAVHPSVSDATPVVHPSVSDATPSTHSSVSDATPPSYPSVSICSAACAAVPTAISAVSTAPPISTPQSSAALSTCAHAQTVGSSAAGDGFSTEASTAGLSVDGSFTHAAGVAVCADDAGGILQLTDHLAAGDVTLCVDNITALAEAHSSDVISSCDSLMDSVGAYGASVASNVTSGAVEAVSQRCLSSDADLSSECQQLQAASAAAHPGIDGADAIAVVAAPVAVDTESVVAAVRSLPRGRRGRRPTCSVGDGQNGPATAVSPAHKFVCPICNKMVTSLTNLRNHVTTHSDAYPHQCPVCDRRFKLDKYLTNHLSVHVGVKQHKCEQCEASFRQRSDLNRHRRRHHGELTYRCDICSKQFTEKSGLKAHLQVHTGDRPFLCSVCGVSLRSSTKLRIHQRVHTGERPYTCEFCGKAFAHKFNLDSHLRIHTGQALHKCELCQKGFQRKSALRQHQRDCNSSTVQAVSSGPAQ